ncbi:MAG: ABC transporter substrate-binding protein [Rhodoglobus sp.]
MFPARKPLTLIAFVALAGVVLSGCATAADSTASSETEAATITLYTSEPQEKIDEIISAFTTQQPNITVEVFRAGTGDLTARIEAERVAGEIQADILLAADAPTFEAYAAEDLLLEFESAEAKNINQDLIDPEGFYVGTRIIPTAIAYNTNLVDAPPTSWQELADPQWADKIVMPNPDVSGAAAFNAAVWYNDDNLGKEWLKKLAANNPVIVDSNGPTSQAIATGTQPVGAVVDYLVRELAEAGSPIAVSYPSDGVPYVSQPAGIFASTDEAAAAELFIDFLLSVEGQKMAVAQSYLPVRNDVGTPEGAPSMDKIKIVTPDLNVISESRTEAVAYFNDLIG